MTDEALDASALLAYAESLVAGRRVVVVGDARLTEPLGALGARVVHVYDPEPERALRFAPTTATRNVAVRTLPDGDFEVRDGAFDVALVPDLAAVPDPSALVVRLRRILGADGVALVAAPNPEASGESTGGFGYYELYDLLSLQWAEVRMVARVPFAGVAFAEVGESEIDDGVSVHTDLAGSPGAPTMWVAVASSGGVDLERYAIVQLPEGEPEAPSAPVVDAAAVAALAEARLRADSLAAQVEELRSVRADAARDAEEARRLREALVVERDRAERLLSELDQERRVRERLATELSAAAASAQAVPAGAVERIAALEDGIRLAEQTILALRERLGATEDALRESAEQVVVLRNELAASTANRVDPAILERLEAELLAAATHQQAHEAELVAMERKLRERGEAIALLEHEVHRRERLVRELLSQWEEAPTGSTVAEDELRRRLDTLARTSAELASELEAARWRISELSRARPATPSTEAESASAGPLTELDALRQALAQEHAARVRAESGEELRLARAELERQAVLLAQLRPRSPD
jgi:hypothetical protein